MENVETIDLKHRECLVERFHRMDLPISDYAFANIYLFRHISNYKFITRECGLFISGVTQQKQHYVMPLNDPVGCDTKTFRDILGDGDFFFPIPEAWLNYFRKDPFVITYDESDSDYIYLTENMAGFKGKQYLRHRNHLNQFLSKYKPDAIPMAAIHRQDAMLVLEEWQHHSRKAKDKTDFEPCREALQIFSELALWGIIYYIDDRPAGFIVGEALNADMFCLHFAKASRNYRGLYEFMFNDTAKRLLSQYKHLNLEEDMGNKNLRRTKYSYGPEFLITKYRVGIK